MYCVVLITAKDKDEAQKISRGLLRDKLIACANIVPAVESHFWWQGKIDSAAEALVIAKTKRRLFSRLARKVKSLHSYDVPEIITLPIIDGHAPYLAWLEDSVTKK